MDPVFMMYAAESEGDIPTRRGKIEKLIRILANGGAYLCNDFDFQKAAYDEVGIDSDTFTDNEMEYIQKEVARRL